MLLKVLSHEMEIMFSLGFVEYGNMGLVPRLQLYHNCRSLLGVLCFRPRRWTLANPLCSICFNFRLFLRTSLAERRFRNVSNRARASLFRCISDQPKEKMTTAALLCCARNQSCSKT